MNSKTPLTLDGAKNIKSALATIEAAQNLLYDAAAHLSNVRGWSDEWESICSIGSDAHNLWHKIEQRRAVTPVVDTAANLVCR